MNQEGNGVPTRVDAVSSQIETIVRSRRSVRRFRPQPVEPQLLQRLIAGACWAPSPHNSQPWRFAVVTDEGSKLGLALAMGTRFRTDLLADGLPEEAVAARVQASIERLTHAPALILVCMVEDGQNTYPDVRRSDAERIMATQSIGAAVQNLLLVAEALELGVCWLCAPLFCPEVASTALDLDPTWQPQALVLVGYPFRRPPVSRRKPSASLVVYR